MGNSSSRMEEDKALQLCRERKKFVRQALDGRCLLASAHVAYIQSLKTTGTALRKFIEPDGLIDPSLYTPSTNATPEPQLALSERPLSHLSFSSPSVSQRIDAAEGFSPSPSPPSSSIKFQANHMKHTSVYSKKVEEKVPVPVIGTLTSSGTPQNGSTPRYNGRSESPAFEDSTLPDGAPQWDFFGLFNPIDHQFSFQDGKGAHHMQNGDDITQLREEEGIPDLEEDEEGVSSHGEDGSQASEDEFEDEPTSEKLVQRFENLNRVNNHVQENALPATTKPSTGDVASEVELVNGEKANSPNLSPLKTVPPAVTSHPPETNKSTEKENHSQNKVIPKNFFSSMKEIESLFIEASASGKEVPRMLEANKFHFRPMFPAKENSTVASSFLKACFSCGDDPTQVPEEPAQNSVKYITWHRTASSRSSSSRNPVGANSRDDTEAFANNLFDTSCMISGSHASTLDRLYAWERKLYDEVKASEIVRKEYDTKCKILRHLESKGEKTHTIDKTRAVVKDLHSRIRVAIHRIDSISKRIEELRDKELQPQLEELIEGLSRMWEVMFECHKLQFQIISVSYNNSHAKIAMHSELHRQITSYLEDELLFLSSSLTKWIGAQKSYLEAISGWLNKCVSFKQKSTRKRRKPQSELLRDHGPPIYATCIVWLEKLNGLPVKDVVDSIKSLAADTARFLPHKEKNHGKGANHPHINGESSDNLLRDDISEDWASGFDRFRLSLIRFLGQLSSLSGASVTMYADLRQAIHNAKIIYQRRSSFSQNGHSNSQSQDVHLNSESQGDQSNSQSQVV